MTAEPIPEMAHTSALTEHDPVFTLHEHGKMQVTATVPLADRDDLAAAYTPGVARVCEAIAADADLVNDYTWVGGCVAVVTDGSSVLGLGDIGPAAAMPVMEGKAILLKEFGGVNAVPLCLDTTDVDRFVDTVVALGPSFGGINLEDISAPRCFEIEARLQQAMSIPVFHDDQHGTAIVVLAALVNALKVTKRQVLDTTVTISGSGAAGVAIAKILYEAGIGDIRVVDRQGVIHADRPDLPPHKAEIAALTNRGGVTGDLAAALVGADAFIGVSGGTVPERALAGMADDAIIFALANPDPEVHPDVAARHATIVATGRSDFPNQINNVLAFPGVFRGALAVRAERITEGMKIAAANALANLVADRLAPDFVIPSALDRRVGPSVEAAVATCARRDGVARR
jgi:malate dehydrogenase (oxaloacetate-decarboxylating)